MCPRPTLLCSLACLALLTVRTAAEGPPRTDEPAHLDQFGDPLPDGAVSRIGTVRFRHAGPVGCLLFSPDGKSLAACSVGVTHLWDVATGRERWRVADHYSVLAFSPDGKRLAHGGERDIVLTDAATGEELKVLKSKDTAVYALAFAPDGKSLASAGFTPGGGNKVRVWDTATGAELWSFDGLVTVAFSPDGKLLAAGAKDGAVGLWDTSTRREIRRLRADEKMEKTERLLFSRDGKSLVVCARTRWGQDWYSLLVWDVGTGKKGHQFEAGYFWHLGLNVSFDLSPDGRLLVANRESAGVQLWDPATGEKRGDSPDRMPACRAVAFSPDGRLLACADTDQALHLWDPARGREVRPVEAPTRGVTSVAITPDGRTVASLTRLDPIVCLWRSDTGRPAGEMDGFKSVNGASYAMALAPGDCPRLVLQGEPIVFWDIATRKICHSLRGRVPRADALATADEGRLLIRGEWDGAVSVQDAADGTIRHRFHGLDYDVTVAASADGKLVAAAGYRRTPGIEGRAVVKVWDAAGGREHPAFREQNVSGTCVALTPDGAILAIAAGSETLFWDTATGRELRRAARGRGRVAALAFAPDGRTLAEGRSDGTVRLVETTTGGVRRLLPGHRAEVTSLAWSADGRLLISGSRDTTVLVWDVTGLRTGGRLPARSLTAEEAERAWRDLGGSDTSGAHRALWRLIADPVRALPLLRERLHAVAAVEPGRLTRLIVDLDSADFSVREQATHDLRQLGELAQPALRQTLDDRVSPELRRRARTLLADLDSVPPPADVLRGLRAVEVLEQIGTLEAGQVLTKLSRGAPAARLTREAKGTLQRLERRTRAPAAPK